MKEVFEAISNLEKTSNVLEKVANDPKNYNTEFAYYLEQMSSEMTRQAKFLKECQFLFGEVA